MQLTRRVLLAIVFLCTSHFGYANSITVDSTHKTMGTISLRTAVATAASGDTIRFSTFIDGDTIKLTTGEIVLDKDLVIIGNGINKTIMDGQDNSRIFHIPSGVSAHISGITLQNGNGVGTSSSGSGGAIFNQGVVHITNTNISGNSATVIGGGVYNENSAIFTNTTISGNTTRNSGGGVGNSFGTAKFTNTTISGNTTAIGAVGGGVYNNEGTTIFTNSTISGNSASVDGGGVYNFGLFSTSTFTNTTISGNTAGVCGGCYAEGGGVYNLGSVTFTNSIVASNTAVSGPDILNISTINSSDYNLIGNTSGAGTAFNVGNNIINTNPLFIMDVPANDSLGGDLRLQCGSPAIDMGTPDTTGLNLGLVDLGGLSRVETKRVDIGAYEYQVADAPTPLLVTTTADAGCGSLRFAVCNAMSGDTIRFDASLDMDTIKLITEISIDTNLVIIGNDTTNTIIDGMATSRIFYIPSGDTVSISGIKMQGGNGVGVELINTGGAILNQGILTLTKTAVNGNSATSSGGGIWNQGIITITNCTLSGNSNKIGSGIDISGGGGVFNSSSGSMTLTNCTLSGNSSQLGGGVYNSAGSMTLTNCTLSGNSASIWGGGVNNGDGGTMTLINSTLSGNSAEEGGGVKNFSAFTLTNSIVAKNTGASNNPDIDASFGSIIDGGHNLIGDGTGQSSLMNANNGNQVGTAMDPIDPLFIIDVPANDSLGGDLRLQCGSPAIDMGTPDTTGLNLGLVDLGGLSRVETKRVDIGAYEYQVADAPTPLLVTTTADAGCGSLRFAVCNAMPGDTIRFHTSLDMDTIKLTSGEITLDKNLVIMGSGINKTIMDGQDNSRIFHIPSGVSAHISGITLQNGNGVGANLSVAGGAIYNEGVVHITNTTISGNSSDLGGAVYNSGGTVTFTNTTISGNTASSGGGVYNSFGFATFTNTTISGNTVAIFGCGACITEGGGVYNLGGFATFTNSIVASNTAVIGPDIRDIGTINPSYYNLIGNTSGARTAFNVGNNIINTNPLFVTNVPTAPSSGGDLRLQCGSPAIDAGTPDTTGLNLGLVDLGGLSRVETKRVDIGAYEYQLADAPTPLLVTTTADAGCGSLRFAVCNAMPGDTIRFHTSLDMDTIKLLTEITIDTNLVIMGNDTSNTPGQANTIIDGLNNSRIFTINTGDTVMIHGLTLQGGDGTGVLRRNHGGAIYNQGVLSIYNSTISNNTAPTFGGGIHSEGELTLTNSRLHGNAATSNSGQGGGTLIQSGKAAFINTVITSNTAIENGGGVHIGPGVPVSFLNCTISGNSVIGNGFAPANGGGIYNDRGPTTIVNTVISGNTAGGHGGGLYHNGTGYLINSTITGNSAAEGGGLEVADIFSSLTITNTIIAKNQAGVGPDIINPSLTGSECVNNLIGDGSGLTNLIHGMNGNQVGSTGSEIDPLFVMDVPASDSLGGDLRLTCGSSAIDAGSNAAAITAMIPATDINGNPRIITKTIDIGAYEFQLSDTPSPVTHVTNLNDSGCGTLRFAICNAAPGDTITFDVSLDGDTIKLITEISIDTNLLIIGNGSINTIIDGIANSRIFNIPAGDTVSISGIKMQGGNGVGVALTNTGGAILNQGTLTLTNSTVSGNSATSSGGGIFNTSSGTLTLTNSTLSGNSATFGGGAFNTSFGTLTLTNSTVSGNSAEFGSGIHNFGTLMLTHTTVSGNSANIGGGIANESGTLTLNNSIIAKNTASGTGPDIYNSSGTIPDGGNNLIGDNTSVATEFPVGPLVGISGSEVDPLFIIDVPVAPSTEGDLRLQCGSPAIDAGSNTAALMAMIPATDINGNPRIITKTIDIGASEFQLADAPTPLLVTTTADAGCGSLRFAVCNAMPGDTIRFHTSLDMDTIKLITEIVIDTNLVIMGNDTMNTIIDGQGTTRIVHIGIRDTVVIDGIKFQNGNGEGVVLNSLGGAIMNQGNVTLTNSTLTGNSGGLGGGLSNWESSARATVMNSTIYGNSAIYGGGGLNNELGTLIVVNSIISGNIDESESGGGGGVRCYYGSTAFVQSSISGNIAPFGGGVSCSNSSLTCTNSTISGNTSTGSSGGGVRIASGTASFINSTISGNTSKSEGGGVYNLFGSTTFTNVTIAGNRSINGGAGLRNLGDMAMINSTISGNTSMSNAGGVLNSYGTLTFTNTIVAKNTGDFCANDICKRDGTIINQGGNHVMDSNGSHGITMGNGIDPLFVIDVPASDSLGGDLRLQCGSPAIDAGTPDTSSLSIGPVDRAGLPRIAGKHIDIGAHEKEAICHEIDIVYKSGISIVNEDDDPDVNDGTDFGETCGVKMDSFYVKNIGQHNLILDSIAMDKPMGSTLTFNLVDFTFPDTLACGDSTLLKITFDPIATGIDSATINIISNDADEAMYSFDILAVFDTTKPALVCMDTTIYLDIGGMAVIDSSFVVSSATDACSPVTLSLGQTSFTCDDLGTQEVIVSATDVASNMSTCTATVTILKTPLMTTQIAGPSTICPGLSQIAYSASTITGATAYQWSYAGTGLSIISNGSSQITLDFASDATAGELTVDVIDACGDVSSSATLDINIGDGAFCALADCAREGIFIDDELLALIGSIDLYRASHSIESNASISSNRNLVFKAGQAITFYPGFTVEQAGVLEAIIEACGE